MVDGGHRARERTQGSHGHAEALDVDDQPRSLMLDELGDRLDAFQLFRKNDESAAKAVLDEIGARDDVDRDIILELGARRPLGHPDRFPEAHALAVRALEVLDRNGARPHRVRYFGPLNPVVGYLVQQVAHFLVRSYQASVIDNMKRLYTRREANCLLNDPVRPMLARARVHAERLEPGFKRNPLGVPTFLLGGAVISTLASVLRSVITTAVRSWYLQVGIAALLVVVAALAAWSILTGASVARRRIRLTVVKPLDALWETVGRAGDPPRDQTKLFAIISVILMIVAVLIIPVAVAILLAAVR